MRLAHLVALSAPALAVLWNELHNRHDDRDDGMISKHKSMPEMEEGYHMDHHSMDREGIADASNTSHSSPSATSETLHPVAHSSKHHHGMPILQMQLTPEERLYWLNYSTTTYFTTPSLSRSSLYVHLALYIAPFVLLYPVVLVLYKIHHEMYLPALTVHSVLVVLSAFSFYIFEASIDDLFPLSAFSTMTTIVLFSSTAHWFLAVVASSYSYLKADVGRDYSELEDDRVSLDSPTSTLRDSSLCELFELDDQQVHAGPVQSSNDATRQFQSSAIFRFFIKFPALQNAAEKCGRVAISLSAVANWAMFAYFFIYFGTGIATNSLYGQDKDMFNLLAHFIKGGVFFVLGLVTFARYCGAFKQKGWAWNHVFVTNSSRNSFWSSWFSLGTWTMEMIESSLILFYGSTNMFLEHLANPGGAWC